jgi:hypothetical protein
MTATFLLRPDPLADLVEQAGDKPIFVISPHPVQPWFVAEIVKHELRRKQPEAIFVNCRGRAKSTNEFERRWVEERERYGAGIVLTVAEPTDEDPEIDRGDIPDAYINGPIRGILGAHIVGCSTWKVASDIAARGRPLLWAPFFYDHLPFVARFKLQLLTEMSHRRFARLFPVADAQPFRPAFDDSSLGLVEVLDDEPASNVISLPRLKTARGRRV